MDNKKKHYWYFDYIRVLAMFGVVFMHSVAVALRIDTASIDGNWHIVNASTSLAFTAVPLFFMMSGFLLTSSSKTENVSYLLKKRLPKLLVPLIVYSALATIQILHANMNLGFGQFIELFANAASTPVMVHFWFMYTLIGMYLISPVLCKGIKSLDSNGEKYLLILILLVLSMSTLFNLLPEAYRSYVPYKIFSEINLFGGHLTSFILGWFLGRTERKFPNFLLIIVAVTDFVFITVMTYFLTIKNAAYTQTFQSQSLVFEILLAACIFLLFKQNFNRPLKKLSWLIKPLTALTFPVYLLHNIILAAGNVISGGRIYPTSALGSYALAFSTVISCYILIKTLATIKPFCFALTGLSYKEACDSCNWIFTAKNIKSLFKKH